MIQAISYTTTSAESVRGILDLLELHDGHDSALDRCGLKPDDVRRLTASMRPAPAPKLARPASHRNGRPRENPKLPAIIAAYRERLATFRAMLAEGKPTCEIQVFAQCLSHHRIAKEFGVPSSTLTRLLRVMREQNPDLVDRNLAHYSALAGRRTTETVAREKHICEEIERLRNEWAAMPDDERDAKVPSYTTTGLAKQIGVKHPILVNAIAYGRRNRWFSEECDAIGERITTASRKRAGFKANRVAL